MLATELALAVALMLLPVLALVPVHRTLLRMSDYRVRLTARNEGLEYRDASGIYRFNVRRDGSRWIVELPPTRESPPGAWPWPEHELTDAQRAVMLPRIMRELSLIWWFGIFPCRYEVAFAPEHGARDD